MTYRIMISIVLCLGWAVPALAREAYFTPALGDVLPAVVGDERAYTTDDGGIALSAYSGDVVPNFPLFVAESVVASSPLIADVQGDGTFEIIFLARSEQNQYALHAYTGAGVSVATVNLGGTDVFADPVAVERVAGGSDILVMDDSGSIKRIRFSNNQFVVANIANIGGAGALAVSTSGDELYISIAEENRVLVYVRNGDGWQQGRVLNTNSPVIYPLLDGGDGHVYGVNRDGNIVALSTQNGAMKAGFPVNTDMSLGQLARAELSDVHAGKELVASLQNGKQLVLTTSGVVVEEAGEQSFVSQSLSVQDPSSTGLFRGLRSRLGSILTQAQEVIISALTRIRVAFQEQSSEIAVTYNGQPYESGTTIDIGSVQIGQTIDVIVTIQNTGEGVLHLSGNPRASVAGDGAFSVTAQPIAFVNAGAQTRATVRFAPQAQGAVQATLSIPNNDENEDPFTITISAQGVNNLVIDGYMEAAGVASWPSYGTPPIKEKSNVAYQGAQSLYINTIGSRGGVYQSNIPVEAGEWYRYSFYYKHNGQVSTFLSISLPNSDYENAAAQLPPTGDTWMYYERVFQIPNNYVSKFRPVIGTVNADLYIDSMVIEPIAAPPLVLDGDMEAANMNYWVRYGLPDLLEKRQEQQGNDVLFVQKLNGNGGVQQTNILVEPDQTYILRFRYQFEQGKQLRAMLNLRSINANGDFEEFYRNIPKTQNGEWAWYERQFTIPENTVDLLSLRITGMSESGQLMRFSLDDVSITRVAAPLLVRDGDMELVDLAAWGDYGALLEKRKDADAHAGAQSLYIARDTNVANNLGVQQIIPVEAGQQYRLRFWYKTNTGVIPILGTANTDYENTATYLYPSNNWRQYERTFTAPQNVDQFRMLFVADRFYYDIPSVGAYSVYFVDAQGVSFIDGVRRDGLGPNDIVVQQPANPHLWIDDVTLERL